MELPQARSFHPFDDCSCLWWHVDGFWIIGSSAEQFLPDGGDIEDPIFLEAGASIKEVEQWDGKLLAVSDGVVVAANCHFSDTASVQ